MQLPKRNILVIGAQNIDLYAHSKSDFLLHDSNSSKIELAFGGVACNIATNLSILGDNVSLLTVFGDDYFSQLARQNLSKLNINFNRSLVVKNAGNSIYLGVMDKANDLFLGLNDMEIVQKLNIDFFEDKRNYIDDFDFLVIDNNLDEKALQYLLTTFEHKTIIMDAVSALKAPKLQSILCYIDLLKVNMLELDILSDKESIKLKLTELLDQGVGSVLLTNSDKEINYISKDKHIITNPIFIDKINNATGAGDAFLSGFIHKLIQEESVEDCLESAKNVAYECLQSPHSTNNKNTGK